MSNDEFSSVEWLVKELNQKIDFIPMNKWDEIKKVIQQAKAMHKEEIMDARTNGKWGCTEKYGEVRTNIQYYNEKFNK